MDTSLEQDLPPSAVEELAFWSEELAMRGRHRDEIARRLDPARRHEVFPRLLADVVVPRLRSKFGVKGPISCLELGSGPVSTLAYGVQAGLLTVKAVDVLASHYEALLRRHGIVDYPVAPRPGTGEGLLQHFGREAFHMTYACNALDHTENAPRSFDNLVELTMRGGAIVLQHHLNEGTHRSWSDSHHWNLDLGAHGLTATSRDGRVFDLGRRDDLELAYLNYRSYALDGWIDAVYVRRAR